MTQEQHPTIRTNSEIAFCLGDFETLSDALDYAARGETGFNFYSPRGKLETVLPYSDLRAQAIETGRRLMKLGLKRGDRIGVVAETTPEFLRIFFGCQYAGLIPCPLPYSMYIGGREAYVARLKGMVESAGVAAVFASDELFGQVAEAANDAGIEIVMTHSALDDLSSEGVDLVPFMANDVAYIQYSSGSTSSPKGVLITQKNITTNARGILQFGLGVTPQDRACSWLPLYHDMGLVGFCLAPMMCQLSVDYLATSAFARRPLLWTKIISDNQCSITYSPSFGYDLAGRRVNGSAKDYDLSSLRVAGIGGDMVRTDILDAFAKAFKPAGFKPTAFLASYGMAEATLAISFSPLDKSFEIDHIKARQYERSCKAEPLDATKSEKAERMRSFVLCGRPLPGHHIEVRNDQGDALGEREIGHIMVSGPSLMACYFQNDKATNAVFDDHGWLKTGDMGYMLDGQIVITGRSKDLILHNGRNIWPQDIEWAVEKLDAVRSDDVAAFALQSEDQEDQVIVLVQCRLRSDKESEALRREVAAIVHRQAGVECDVVLVPPRSLPFTSSGKLSRARAKLSYISGEIADISRQIMADKLGMAKAGLAQNAAK